MKSVRQLLEEQPFAEGLTEDLVEVLAGCGRLARFDAGDLLCRTGEEATTFHLLRSGRVAIEIPVPAVGPVVVETVGEGQVVGASWVVEPRRWNLDARAIEPVATITFDAVCLGRKGEADPRLGYELMRRIAAVFAERLQATRLRLIDVYGQREAR